MKNIAFITLGCKVNQYETQAMTEITEKAGYTQVEDASKADVVVVNTCTVTGIGDKKVRQTIRKVNRNNPNAVIVATGCYAQRSAKDVSELTGVKIVIGTKNRAKIVNYIEQHLESGEKVIDVEELDKDTEYDGLFTTQKPKHTHANIKIQDGCNRFCSYCIIPYTRGPVRSRNINDILTEVKSIADNGCIEVVITGIHIASYGIDLNENIGLINVLEAIHKIDGIKRIRIGSLEPVIITPEWIERLKGLPKVCKHFHLSLQSGSDSVLKRMHRRYTTKEYFERVIMLKQAFENCSITTDIMAGFPGESDAEFEESATFMRKVAFSRTHVFPYSIRPGTLAADFPDKIDKKTRLDRASQLIKIADKLENEFVVSQIGSVQEVLFELRENEIVVGYTENYVRVHAVGSNESVGRISSVNLIKADGNILFGEIV